MAPPPDDPRQLPPAAATVLASVGDAVITTSEDFRVTSWNRAARELYGWSEAEALGADVGRLLGTAWEGDAAREAAIQALAADGHWRGEVTQRRRDGRLLHVLAAVTTLRDERGERVGLVAVNRDITAQRQAEEALAQVEARVAEAARAEALSEVAGLVAHDVNNVLAVIAGHAELASEALPPGHAARRSLEHVTRGVLRGAEMTRQLVSLARRDPADLVALDVARLVRAMHDRLGLVVGPGVRLVVDGPPRAAWARASAHDLEQAVLNLVVNAREAAATTVTVRVGVGAGQVRVEVADDGVGMAPEVLLRAVEAFYTTKVPSYGAGLGLAVVSQVVTRCGGAMSMWSEPGRGARIGFSFPEVGEPAPRSDEGGRVTNLRVLLAEDQEPVREVLAHLLRSLGHEVVLAEDGAAAVEIGRRGGFDVLVTDVSMPRLSGPAAAAALRAEQPELPVVYVSGFPREEAGAAMTTWPRGVFRRKPVKREELRDAIVEAVRGGRE